MAAEAGPFRPPASGPNNTPRLKSAPSFKPTQGSVSSGSSMTCQRCMQPLRLDESLSDETLQASAASSSSNEGGLTQSKYDVISSLVPHYPANHTGEAKDQQSRPPLNDIRDPHLREAVLNHFSAAQSATKDSDAINEHSTTPHSLSSQLALHARLFDLVSSYAPSVFVSLGDVSSSDANRPDRELSMGIDHPLCRDCSDYCIDVMRQQMSSLRKERDAFQAWQVELQRLQGDEGEIRRMEAEIVELEELAKKATESLYTSERSKAALEDELRQLNLEEKALEQQEAEFWNAYSKQQDENQSLKDTKEALQRSIQSSEATLARLNATNVFFDAFCIGHEGGSATETTSRSASSSSRRKGNSGSGLATINGLRFGRVSLSHGSGSASGYGSTVTVDWNEVNAAWGQVALLVENLRTRVSALIEGSSSRSWSAGPGKRVGREFKGWRIHPKGSTSYLSKLAPLQPNMDQSRLSATSSPSNAATLGSSQSNASSNSSSDEIFTEDPHELHHPNSWASLTRMLHLRRFDAAMVGMLDCTAQLFRWSEEAYAAQLRARETNTGDHVARQLEEPPRMIHAINGEKIGDVSIRLVGAFTSEENWSRALKYLLVNLQVIMRWATQDDVVKATSS